MNGDRDKIGAEMVEMIFSAALACPPAQRVAYLADACGDNQELHQRVEALLSAHETCEGFLPEQPRADLEDRHAADVDALRLCGSEVFTQAEKPGDCIGRYRLLETIGEGGFGVVYVAEQREPVKRRVALKIIKLGMDTKHVVARFEAERQALALMDHPNIAKVLDAGATETGRPYFVMELVKGISITNYCDQEKLATRERLDLFIRVCHAIQHAHQKGIIHRDIKPSNILITLHDGVPVPKVIDFGIAKATQQELTERTVYTQFHQFIGTPAYMSPEQAEMSGLDIDTRSDIYSLGVLLYELLTGSTPFDTKELLQSGLDEMRKIIREREPVRPSTRLRQTAALRLSPTQLSSLNTALSTDLDWIVMKCLEKDRKRRYETANGVARDIERHLKYEPVVARPPSNYYRLGKLVYRHKMAVGAGFAIAAALVIGTGVSTWMFLKEREARRRTMAAEWTAKTEADQLVEALRLWRAGGSDDLRQAEAFFRQTLQTQKTVLGENSLEVAATLNDLAGVLQEEGKSAEAEAIQRQAVELKRKVLGDDHLEVARALSNLGLLLQRQAKLPKAETVLREALGNLRRRKDESSLVGVVLHHLADVLREEKSLLEARSLAQEAVTLYTRHNEWPAKEQRHARDVLGLVLADWRDAFGPSLKVGDPAPKLDAGRWVQGEPVKQFEKGRSYLVEFWATWCLPCRDSIAHLNELYAKYGSRGLTIIGQDCQEEDEARVAPFVKAMGASMFYPIALDDKLEIPKGAMAERWLTAAGIDGIPAAFLVDKSGSIAWIGHPLKLEDAVIEQVLAGNFDIASAAANYAATQKIKLGVDRALSLLRDGKLNQAEQPLDEALTQTNQASAEVIQALALRAELRARRGQWQTAASDLARVVEADPSDHRSWYLLAPLLLLAGDLPAYQNECHAMLARFSESADPMIAERAAKVGLLHPGVLNAEELVIAGKLAARGVDTGQDSPWLHWFQLTRGLALYRQGDFASASEWMQRIQNRIALSNDAGKDMCEADSYFVLAMAQYRRGGHELARASLERGLQIVQNKLPGLDGGDLGRVWYDALMTRIFMSEAKELVGRP